MNQVNFLKSYSVTDFKNLKNGGAAIELFMNKAGKIMFSFTENYVRKTGMIATQYSDSIEKVQGIKDKQISLCCPKNEQPIHPEYAGMTMDDGMGGKMNYRGSDGLVCNCFFLLTKKGESTSLGTLED